MTEFLAENNACGRNLLSIVSMGNSIIAEILRLKDYIPSVFRLDNKADQRKYADIVLDFSYLEHSETHEEKISNNEELKDLDDEIRENYLELITRFYLAFESTLQYANDLQQFLRDLNDGYYIQQTVESVMQDEEGKQLMCESLYLFGVILLIIDYHIPGIIRERLLVAYYRYSGTKSNSECNIDDVCMLLRSTGYTAANAQSITGGNTNKSSLVPQYPILYFTRYQFDKTFIDMVIGRLRCDDIYNQLSIYPHPDHRSTALSGQAAMLFVCLFFAPHVLVNQVSQMREIVDRFFPDNFSVSIYMGITANLIDAWDQFKAAKAALANVIETNTIKSLCSVQQELLKRTLKKTREFLREGALLEDFVLQNISKIVVLLRECNVVLRWYFMHSTGAIFSINTPNAKMNLQQVIQQIKNDSGFKVNEIFQLLLNCSELELTLKEILRNLIEKKNERWSHFKNEATTRVKELSETFSGTRPILKVEKNPQLKSWFNEITKEIIKLDFNENINTGHTLIQLIEALNEVQEFHNLQANMHIKQYLQETRDCLHKMRQIINIKEDILINIQLISDFSYAWLLIDRDFTTIMQESIKNRPKSVIKLRAVFLKLASTLEVPLLRINQAKSEDLISVSNYYSSELVNYVRKVLQIIPETMFNILARIIKLQTEVIKEIPARLDKDKLVDYAQYDERYMIAELTYSISTFTEGILMMKKTLVGIIELDPKRLLEDGIRKELVRHLSNALNVGLIISPASGKSLTKISVEDLETKLSTLANTISGYVRSFEYIQDFLNIHGLKMLQEEMTRIINYNVEKECNVFLRNKVQDWQSKHQSSTIPIPTFAPLTDDVTKSNNFIGRLARALLICTDPKITLYLDLDAAWYEKRPPHKSIMEGRQFFIKVREAIGPAGLVGLDRLYSHMITDELQRNLDKIQKNVANDKMWSDILNELTNELEDVDRKTDSIALINPMKFYSTYHSRWIKVWPKILDWILGVGHKQILRQQLSFELSRYSRCNAKGLVSSLETFNRALINELTLCEPESEILTPEMNNTLAEVSEYLMFTGSYEPLEQVFIKTKNSHYVALFLSLFTIAHIDRFEYSHKTHALLTKSHKDPCDGIPLMLGISTILQQFHKDVSTMYLTYLCQYVNLMVEALVKSKNDVTAINTDVLTMLRFLKIYVRLSNAPQNILSNRIPETILYQMEDLATDTTA